MTAHFSGQKAKELYFEGHKIKEAHFNGQKVYSSAKPALYYCYYSNLDNTYFYSQQLITSDGTYPFSYTTNASKANTSSDLAYTIQFACDQTNPQGTSLRATFLSSMELVHLPADDLYT